MISDCSVLRTPFLHLLIPLIFSILRSRIGIKQDKSFKEVIIMDYTTQTQMNAVIYQKPGTFTLEKRPLPQIKDPTDAIVKVTLASICSSDIHIKHGSVPKAKPGVIVGHEMVGEIAALGSQARGFSVGDRVTVNVETFCGKCFFCQRGFVNNCTNQHGGWALGCRIDGGQAEYVRVPYAQNGLNRIPEGVSDEQAIFTGDILATGFWGAKISEIQPGDTVAVIGAGPTGLCTMLCCQLYHPARIVAIDTDDFRLSLAKKEGMADITVNPRKENPEKILKSLTDGRGADVVLEVAGGKDTFQTAWKIARPNAVVCVVALYEEAQTLPLPDMYGKNLTFKTGGVDGCNCDEILNLIASGKLDTTSLITHRYPLSKALEAYDLFEQKKDHVIKAVLKP